MNKRRHFLAALALAAMAGLVPAGAEDYPNKPIKIVVPFGPGAANDTLARITADALQPRLGQPVVVENKPGAGSAIGVDHVAKSPADGYTLLWAASDGLTVLPAVKPDVPYKVPDEFTLLCKMFDTSFMVVISSALPAKNMTELVTYLKANPGKVRFGTSGAGSLAHLALALMESRFGVKLVHVPYKGMANVVTDLLGGHIDMAVITPPTVSPHRTSEKIRILATTGSKRTSVFPDLPTIKEAGLADVVVEVWFGLVGPANLPANVSGRIQKEVAEILKDPEWVAKYKKANFDPSYAAAEPFKKIVLDELKQWKDIATREKIVLE